MMGSGNNFTLNRREFLATTAAAGVMAAGMPGAAQAAMPKRGGTLRYSTRVDGRGLDPHRNIIYYVSNPLVGTTQGLLDLNQKLEIVPAVAEEWEISKDLMKYTYRIRKDVEFHNGRTVDSEAVKWNFERILQPTSYAFTRASLGDIERMETDGPNLLHVYLKNPSALFNANVVYYPCNLIAPDSEDQADTHPIGCGPFKFVSWKRYAKTELVRFENYFEMGADGKPLPYLDAIEAYPKREDKVRLTALRTGEVDMIENMSYFDAPDFKESQGDEFKTYTVPQLGMAHLNLNAKSGPFAMSGGEDAKMLRAAVAHAIDKQGIHEAVFNGLGETVNHFYAKDTAWHIPDVPNEKEYDPEKTRFILRKLNMENMPIAVVARASYQYMRNSGEITHAMLLEAGFGATNEVFDNPVLRQKYKKDDWGIDSTATSFRFEPDGWYSRWIHSEGAEGQLRCGFSSERCDKLIEEARLTTDVAKRKELYREVDGIVNDEAALIYSHAVPMLGASTNRLQGYAPAASGTPSWSGGGIRTAYFDDA